MQMPVESSGDYYIILQSDAGSTLGESDVNNNTRAIPIHFDLPPPDLAPIAFQALTNITTSPNPTITLVWGVTNQGPGMATNSNFYFSWYNQVYFSTNATLDTDTDQVIFTGYSTPTSLAPGEVYWSTNLVRVPVNKDGNYYLHLQVNADRYRPLHESDYANNVATTRVSLHVQQCGVYRPHRRAMPGKFAAKPPYFWHRAWDCSIHLAQPENSQHEFAQRFLNE